MISRRQSTRKALIVSSAKLTSKDSKTRKPHVTIATFTAYSSEIEATQVYYSFFLIFLLYEFNYTLNNSYFSLRLKKKKENNNFSQPTTNHKALLHRKISMDDHNIIRKYERTKDISPH